jgi:hypothetical protein
MVSKTIISFVLAVLLTHVCFSQQQSLLKPAYKLKDVTEFGCCGIDLELSILIEALRNEPEARAHIIGYSGPGDPPGKLLRHLRYMEICLRDSIGNNTHPVSVINGGQRDEFIIEMWIVPKDAAVPIPESLSFQGSPDTSLSYLFDEAEASVMEYDKKSYLSFGLACTLSFPDWGEFFHILRDKPELRGHIITYVGREDRTQYANRIQRFLRAYLKQYYGKQVKELTMVYGGKREWSEIEIWLVPRGNPDPNPTAKPNGPTGH